MPTPIRSLSAASAVCLLVLLFAASALAEYPRRPISLVTPYAAGGSSDLAARSLAASAPAFLGQPVIVINKGGAGGVLGTTYVSRSRPDGYTMLMGRIGSNCLVPALNETIAYAWDDFTFIGLVELNPFVFVVRADSPYKTLDELVQAIKANPGTITYSTSGPQSLLALGTQMLLDQAGLEADATVGIPYKGGGNAATALLGGHVHFLGVNLGPVLDQIRAGKLRALAITTKERFAELPDVPTVRECGFPGLESVVGWSALMGPRNMSQDAAAAWREALPKIADDPQWRQRARQVGTIPYIRPAAETKAFIESQYEMYKAFGARHGLTIK